MKPNHLIALLMIAAGPLAAEPASDIPAQTFWLDPAHTSLVFSINHIGLSDYSAGFDKIRATLALDPADPAGARLSVTIAVASLDLPDPPEGFLAELLGPSWLKAGSHPVIGYESLGVTLTGADTARIDGTLTMLGVSAPVTLVARFNGGYAAKLFEPHARIGFSATGSLSRSAFGLTIGVPPPGSVVGVGDLVDFRIEAEFTGETVPD